MNDPRDLPENHIRSDVRMSDICFGCGKRQGLWTNLEGVKFCGECWEGMGDVEVEEG